MSDHVQIDVHGLHIRYNHHPACCHELYSDFYHHYDTHTGNDRTWHWTSNDQQRRSQHNLRDSQHESADFLGSYHICGLFFE